MKKYLLMLVMMIASISMYGQSQMNFRATSLAIAQVNEYTGKYVWSDWERTSVRISFDIDFDEIRIFSDMPQRYRVVTNEGTSTDASGGSQVRFKVIDQDNTRGYVRLRVERNGNSQIYVDFANVAWVYNVVRVY